MKKVYGISVLVATVFMIASCDYVRNAAQSYSLKKPGNRKILIEDYTGHKCGNCPKAADELMKLDSLYKGQIIPLAVHAGFFANINVTYPTDLRSSDGTAWDNTFGNSAAGNPNGFVNRADFTAGTLIKQYSEWSPSAAMVYSDSSAFDISIVNSYNTSNNQLTCVVRTKALALVQGTYNLSVLVMEDSIVGEQLDYRLDPNIYPGQIKTNYVFNHVMRGAVNTTWGEQIFAGTVLKNDSIVKTYPGFSFPTSWKYKHCSVIAFIYDADPNSARRYEILQAEVKEVW